MGQWLTLALVQWVALMSPGPDFFYVSQTAASRSRRDALAGVAGIALGVAIWAALALAGLTWLFARASVLAQVVAVAGGAYLVWMGAHLLRAGLQPAPAAGNDAPAPAANARQALRAGLATNLSNPKVVVYFGSIFAAFIRTPLAVGARWGLWLMIVAETLAWFALVASVFALPRVRAGYLRARRFVDGGAGLVFIGFGLELVATRGAF